MADSDQIKVVIRVRPLIQREQQAQQDARWFVQNEKLISQRDQPSIPPYAFDQVYDRDCSTWELYSGVIGPIVEAAMNGYHGTVFAYGQSGSGKTYTMSGDKMTPGVIAQAMNDIFDFIEQKPSHEFLMRASYMEIYNEKIYDLLSKEDNHLKLHETPDHQINVVGLEEELVHSCEHVLSVIQKGEANRKFAETKQNDRSSRSHCIFRIIIESRKRNETAAAVMVSHLNFVDLAGSEKAGENSGDRFREGCSINMSLFCLSNVISKLSEGIGKQFIGYRDSKLTRILQNALGGNSKTVIVATINPTTIEESHSTLRFATRAKTIKNKPHVNEVLSDAALLKKYRNQIAQLEKLVKDRGVADNQSAHEDLEDLKKQLEEKESLIQWLTKHVVVSSSTDKTVQKKKMRRETWCGSKVQRKSFFPSLASVHHPSVTIREESDMDLELARSDDLGIPFTNISVFSNDEAKAKEFLRRSEEIAPSESLLSATAGSEGSWHLSGSKDLEDEVERLREVMRVMEAQHGEEVDKLQERIKQLEYEKALDLDLQEEREKSLVSGQEEVTALKEKAAHMEYKCQMQTEENHLLQKVLWHAEEEVKRLTQETCHLCDKRFDFTLREWEELKAAKTALEDETKQLLASLQQKNKDIEELQKALSGQEPYISRLEQQLEMYMGSESGQLGVGKVKRRSGIPVLMKAEEIGSPEPATSPKESSSAVASESGTVRASQPAMVDCATSTEDLPQISTTHTCEVTNTTSQQQPSQSEGELSSDSVLRPTNSPAPPRVINISQSHKVHAESPSSVSSDVCAERDVCNISALSFKREEVFSTQAEGTVLCSDQKELDMVTPEKDEGMKSIFSSMESSTKRATQLKRRSDGVYRSPEGSAEVSAKLRKQEQELEQATGENIKLLEVLNQANAEIVRYKEAMEAMEQADAERMDELSEVPKLRALLNRREMEIQRLESLNDRLKEDLNQQVLNSSVSSLSSSFTEPRRKSSMLKEREAEIWKLKDQLIQQAKRLDDVQQEKIHLEDMMSELQTQGDKNENEEDHSYNGERRLSTSSAASSVPSVIEVNTSVREEEEPLQVVVTEAEMESVKRMILDKDSQISHLKAQLQEKEEEMEQMFEGQMLVSSDMIQSHLQQAEQQKDKIEKLEGQLKSREEEVAKLRAKAELHHSSSSTSTSSQPEESAFLEQLIMDKMTLEENLQEKIQELSQTLEQNKELQVQLDERRAMINELRQQHEDTTEVLLSTQEELIALKRLAENEQAQKSASVSQHSEKSCTEEALPASKGDDSFEVVFKAQPTETTGQPPAEELMPAKDEDSSFEVSFKMTGPKVRDEDGKTDHVDHLAHSATEPSKSVQKDDSFEVSFKTTETETAVPSNSHFFDRIRSLEESESELLELLKEKEQQIQALLDFKEQILKSSAAGSEKRDKSPEAGDGTTEGGTPCSNSETTAVPLEAQCEALMEEKTSLENKLQDVMAALEEKTILEAKVQELLKVVDEKSSVISQLGKHCGKVSSQTENLQEEPTESDKKPTAREIESVEKESLLSQLSRLSQVEECLENNIKMLEQSQAEKAAVDERVKDLEAKLEQLTRTEEKEGSLLNTCSNVQSPKTDALQTEKKELETDLKQKTTELESLQSEIQQLKSANNLIVSQKTELENEAQELKAKEKSLQTEIQQSEETRVQLTEVLEQCHAMESKIMELTGKMEEQTGTIEQMTSEQEEINAELTWQTKESERLQNRVEELETELEESKQEAEDLVQELEKVQKLLDDSEHCQRVVEDTLQNVMAQNVKLEADMHSVATERDEFEIQAEAAVKEKEHLQLELTVTSDRSQNRISALESELQTMQQRKEVLEAALADKESAQHMGEMLHEKLSVDLQESQAEVGAMKTTLSQLQFQLQTQESKSDTLNKIIANLEAEKGQWGQEKSSLEKEKGELEAKLSGLQRDLGCRLETEKSKQALETQLQGQQTKVEQLQVEAHGLKQQVEADRHTITHLQQEREEMRRNCQQLVEKTAHLESRCTQAELQCQQMTRALQQLQKACEEKELGAKSECTRLQDELGSKLEHIEQLEKQLADLKASGDSSSAGEKMIPLIEVKKQKLVLKAKINDLARQLESVKNASQCKDMWIKELHEKLSKYENEEQEDKEEKIQKLEEAIKKLGDGLKAKDMELVGIKMKQQEAISKLSKQLSNAEEMVTYKEQIITKLKGELRRIRSEEVSFCSTAAPKARAPEPVRPAEGERVISSHSGIIDRYTVTLLEADKYKLQKELKKTQDRLKCRESELHLAKVALAKAKAGDGPSPSPHSTAAETAIKQEPKSCQVKVEQKSSPSVQTQQPTVMTPACTPPSASCLGQERQSSLSQRMGTSVDGGFMSRDFASRGAGDSVLRSASDSLSKDSFVLASASSPVPKTGSDSMSRTWKQDTGPLQSSLSAGGTPVDVKRDRPVLPSAIDKENTPVCPDVFPALRATTHTAVAQDVAGAGSSINVQSEFWKKSRRPKPSALGKSAAAGADQCKTQ